MGENNIGQVSLIKVLFNDKCLKGFNTFWKFREMESYCSLWPLRSNAIKPHAVTLNKEVLNMISNAISGSE